MRKLIGLIISFYLFSSNVYSQSSVENILSEIKKNSTTLQALRKNADAEKIGNKTGIYLQNPEIEFNYLWGNPSAIGNRSDVRVTQTFDFPSAYKYKNRISENKNEQAELEYQKQKKELLLQTRLICNQLVFQNALKAELQERYNQAESISSAYKSKFDLGETNILEYNKAGLNLLNVEKELESVEIERNYLLSELKRFNGGIPIDFPDDSFQTVQIPIDFEQWYLEAEQNNPVLSWLKQEIEISENREKLNRAMSLPKLQTGYMSEKTVAEHFQGVTVGLSIPLWENKNIVKYAAAQTLALQSMAADNKLRFYNQLKTLHAKAVDIQKNASDYRSKLQTFNNSELLEKALDGGEINLIDYMLELSIYFESKTKVLEMEKELNNTLAELNQFM